MTHKIGLGGSCHWCTEAIFQSLKGVAIVEQGWIASDNENTSFSEAVIVTFNPEIINLQTLIEIHLHTHSCTANHNMRSKYRSAVYTFDHVHAAIAQGVLNTIQSEFPDPIITAVLPFKDFRRNEKQYLNYYYSDPEKPFCKTRVNPKLRLLLTKFAENVSPEQLIHLQS